MTHFPLFLDLNDKDILIFGGGNFALQRIEKLMPFSPKITVISPSISEAIKSINGINILERDFEKNDLKTPPSFVIIAENEDKTACIYAECKKRHIPVNAVDMPKYCDIIFPSLISSKHLCIGISSGGISPTATVAFKEQIEKLIPQNIDEILEWMPLAREYIKSNVPTQCQRFALRELFKAALDKERPLDESEILDMQLF